MRSAMLLFVLSLAGLAFSGYLSAVKFFTSVCALGETCPYFIGYPSCYFGFAMFVVLAVASLMLVAGRGGRIALHVITDVAVLGILFAGYFTFGEISVLFTEGPRAFAMGLPTCAWGLVMYIAILIVSFKARQAA